MKTVTLADFRPAERADGHSWAKARVESADEAISDVWQVIETVTLDPIDLDPSAPALRSFTVSTDKDWLRITFLGEDGGEEVQAVFSTSPHSFRPTVAEIAGTLRARTYSKGIVDPDDPMAAVAGGERVGDFTDATDPSADEVELQITQACIDLAREVGDVPGEMLSETRRVAVIKAAAEIERSYIPTQAEDNRGIFQTLRMTADENVASLKSNLWMWRLANRGME